MEKTAIEKRQEHEAITREIMAGDEQAFQTFVAETHQKGVFHATLMLKNRQDAEDVVQNVYIELIN